MPLPIVNVISERHSATHVFSHCYLSQTRPNEPASPLLLPESLVSTHLPSQNRILGPSEATSIEPDTTHPVEDLAWHNRFPSPFSAGLILAFYLLLCHIQHWASGGTLFPNLFVYTQTSYQLIGLTNQTLSSAYGVKAPFQTSHFRRLQRGKSFV